LRRGAIAAVAVRSSEDGRSNTVCFNTLPAAVTDFQLGRIGFDALSLRWSADATDTSITGFRITRDGVVLRTVDAATRSLDDSGLTPQTQYCYELSAINSRADVSDPARLCLATGWRDDVVASAAAGARPLNSALAVTPSGAPVITYVLVTPETAASGDLWLARAVGATWRSA